MSTDDAVSALEAERNSFDASILEIDRLILKLEQYAAGSED